MKTRHLLLVFIPAILLVFFAIFIRFVQYIPSGNDEVEEPIENEIQIPIMAEDPIIGDKKAPITIIAFDDLGCSACQSQYELLLNLIEKYPGKIKIIWKGLSITNIPYPSYWAHEYAFCANEQNKFIDYKNVAITNSDSLDIETLPIIAKEADLNPGKLNDCLNSSRPGTYIKTVEEMASALNIQSVPTFFLNNIQIKAPQTIEGWEALLQL